MSLYEILTLVISFFSIIVSFIAVIIAYLPYSKKIVFKVILNPFVSSSDGFEIRFLIINKTNKDLIIEGFSAIKLLSIQIFDKNDFPNLVKANSSERFAINSSKLKFSSIPLFNDELIEKKEKNLKHIKFCIVNSVRDSITYKLRMRDFINACRIYKLHKKIEENKNDSDSIIKLQKEMSYYGKRNKSKY
ncbi:MAG: hypothetical protein K2N57_01855 [Clostridia bacterium]|nr:hypothetical protein [Clostridia bacterium]